MMMHKKKIVAMLAMFTLVATTSFHNDKVLAKETVTEYEVNSAIEVTQEDTSQESNSGEDDSFMVTMQTNTSHVSNFGYWLYRPTQSTQEKLPLIIYLHGISERGNNLNKLITVSLPMYLYQGDEQVNAVVIAPQCPQGKTWASMTGDLMELIRQVVEEQNIDQSRISLTGHSLGGIGTLRTAIENPEFFAAIAPVSANINAKDCAVLTSTEIWAFHGSADYAMGFSIQDAEKVVKNAGGDMDLTMFSGKAHAITDIVYHNADINLLDWLASQKRTDVLPDGTKITSEMLVAMQNLESIDMTDIKVN